MATIEPNFESICINPNDDLVLYKKEIVRSRIEKFLYAICSLDNDDLPTPLTRIEEMYKCLVTGVDFITFTPLSRAEKFVMAMLGAYDVELLPTPISRSETLMKKIATGDNNLDDVDNLQSRYEFLLAYIIKAGGFNGGSGDFYYVNYPINSSVTTLYNTIERPVKSAVLKGNTLVNVLSATNIKVSSKSAKVIEFNVQPNVQKRYVLFFKLNKIPTISDNSDNAQFLKFEWYHASASGGFYSLQNKNVVLDKTMTIDISPYTGVIQRTSFSVWCRFFESGELDMDVMIIEYQEGMENWDIPYFEGMQSVKMPVLTTTGKNLFDGELQSGRYTMGEGSPFNDSSAVRTVNKITVKPSTKYTISVLGNGQLRNISEYNNGNYIGGIERYFPTYTFETSSTTNEIHISFQSSDLNLQVQLEENPEVTLYEPYKSTTVLCNEEIELRRIGDIKDELNLVTGELTQRIGEVVLNGDENWNLYGSQPNQVNTVAFKLPHTNHVSSWGTGLGCCDKIPFTDGNVIYGQDLEGVTTDANNIIVRINKSKASSVDEFKAWLSNNNIRVVYPLKEEVIKTVDLLTVDQNNKETELTTFDDVTHVTVSSEGLVPTGEIVTSRPIYFMNYLLDNGLTTFDNTVEYPVKNAVLRGQTLVNLAGECRHNISTVENPKVWAQKRLFLTNVKTNTRYTLKVKMTENVKGSFDPRVQVFFGDTSSGEVNTTSDTLIFTSPSALSSQPHLRLITTGATAEQTDVDFEILLLEGEFPVECNIPYFDYMQSVKMPVLTTTGKNLIDFDNINDKNNVYITVGRIKVDTANKTINGLDNNYNDMQFYVYLEKGKTYKFSANGSYNVIASVMEGIQYSHDSEKVIQTFNVDDSFVFEGETGTHSLHITNFRGVVKDIQLAFEPNKSIILTCNEEVELCRIGDIRDELNLVTGELIQRIGTYTFTGDEPFKIVGNPSYFEINLAYIPVKPSTNINASILCNRLPTINYNDFTTDNEGINLTYTIRLNFKNCHASQGATVGDLKAYLKANPTTICYPLVEVVKTVDLSIVDQDGNETELSTFDNITHFLTSSEELAPTGEIDIARPIQFVDYSLDNGVTTLYNTNDYPVKNAVLKGQTLVNLSAITGVTILKPGDVIFIENTGMKKNTTYTIMFNCSGVPSTNFVEIRTMMDNTQITQAQQNVSVGYNKFTIKTNASKETNRFRFKNDTSASTDFIFSELLILEGDYTNENIPYFTGIQSVKMPVLTMSNKDDTKSNILTCNEEVELRGIGDIKDELNLMTGVYTKVVYEYTFTGDEDWTSGGSTGGYTYFMCRLNQLPFNYSYKTDANIPIYCDKLPTITYSDFDNGVKSVGINLTYFFRLNFSDCDSNNGATVEDLKAYLKANPTTVQYPISKSVKTVDLSVVDQAENVLLITENREYIITENGDYIKVDTKYKEKEKETGLSTFDDITHVTVSSEGLIPTGEITVATKDATDVIEASVMSLRMDDILNSQSTLEGSANAQSDDIDVTMLGTTDIYEQLL